MPLAYTSAIHLYYTYAVSHIATYDICAHVSLLYDTKDVGMLLC